MKYRITSVERVTRSGLVKVGVELYADDGRLLHQTDFMMQLTTEGTRATSIDRDDRVLATESYTVDVRSIVQDNVTAYLRRYVDDRRTRTDDRDRSDTTERPGTDTVLDELDALRGVDYQWQR